jgi:glycosyltransferase involved in cell wall biosynthesis
MNVLLVVPWDQEVGGVVSVVGNLAKYLESQGHKVVFFNFGHQHFLKKKTTKWGFLGYDMKLRSMKSDVCPPLGGIAFWAFFPITLLQIIWLLHKHKIQVVNIHYAVDTYIFFAICRWLFKIKLVVSIHGADFFPDGNPQTKYSRFMKWLLSSADRIVSPSYGFLREFLALFPSLQSKSHCIHNGMDFDELGRLEDASSSEKLGKYLMCIAAHVHKKGIDVLLQAFDRLRTFDPEIRLVLVGDGPLREKLEDLSSHLNLGDSCIFLGTKKRREINKLLHGCQAFVLPSRSEPFGISIIEAMFCGKAVIASAVGGIPEIITNGENGLLVEPDNSEALYQGMKEVLYNDALREKIGSNGKSTVIEKFSYVQNGKTYERLFGVLLEDGTEKSILRKSVSITN